MNRLLSLLFLIIILVGFCFSCRPNKNPCSLSSETLKWVKWEDSIRSVPENLQRYETMMKNEYNEPSLVDAEYETYRLIIHSAWSFWRVIRIEKRPDNYYATIKQFGQDTSYSDTTTKIKELIITSNEWNKIRDGLNTLNFWTYLPKDTLEPGLDGATWTLEGYKPKKDPCTFQNFHTVYRWGPRDSDSNFINMCYLLNDLYKD